MAKGKQPGKPNILVMWGDDIGQSNLSCYTKGMMGYRTPNIDRIANEGMIFTDYYAEQSCTAGRASFITGQCGFRTGLSKVGMPGAELGLQGGGHHYRRSAQATRLSPPASSARTTSATATSTCRRCMASTSSSATSTTSMPRRNRRRWTIRTQGVPGLQEEIRAPRRAALLGGRRGKPEDREHRAADQEAHGDLRRRVHGGGQEVHQEAAHDAGEPFFVWFNTSHMHVWTHVKPESRGQSGRW